MAQAVKTFAGTDAVMQKIIIVNILKGFSEAFSEPMSVISVIFCKNAKKKTLLFQLSHNQRENPLQLSPSILKS